MQEGSNATRYRGQPCDVDEAAFCREDHHENHRDACTESEVRAEACGS
jgi:hypothetical protein